MDPVVAAFGFGTIVQLIGQFRSGRQSSEPDNIEDFLKWLEDHNNEQIKKYIYQSEKIADGIKSVLNQNRDDFLTLLNDIDGRLATLLAQNNITKHLALAIYPTAGIPDQAIEILKWLVNSPSSDFIVHKSGGVVDLITLLQGGGSMQPTERQYILADLDKLADLGLLTKSYTPKGTEKYSITREAERLVKGLSK